MAKFSLTSVHASINHDDKFHVSHVSQYFQGAWVSIQIIIDHAEYAFMLCHFKVSSCLLK